MGVLELAIATGGSYILGIAAFLSVFRAYSQIPLAKAS